MVLLFGSCCRIFFAYTVLNYLLLLLHRFTGISVLGFIYSSSRMATTVPDDKLFHVLQVGLLLSCMRLSDGGSTS